MSLLLKKAAPRKATHDTRIMPIDTWLTNATKTLTTAGSSTSRLDALVLLEYVTQHTKTWLLAHGDTRLDQQSTDLLKTLLARRVDREPIAYIIGSKEFYGREFTVSPATLIPRPETEALIELLDKLELPETANIIDVGTGSGAIAITVKLEHPDWHVAATDVDMAALTVAKNNATKLLADVDFTQNNLLDFSAETTGRRYNAIIANLPYVAADSSVSPETEFEPPRALYADNDGLALIFKLIEQSPSYLNPKGFLLLEAEPEQMPRIINHANTHGFVVYSQSEFSVVLQLA